MKALTLRQPWATLVAIGAKEYETRSWPAISFSGPLAIHAAKKFPPQDRDRFYVSPFHRVLKDAGFYVDTHLPRGMVVATIDRIECCRTDLIADDVSDDERAFGDFQLGRWAWRLIGVHCLAEPIPARGRQRLWDWEPPA